MQSLHIVCSRPKSEKDNFYALLECCVDGRYIFTSRNYDDVQRYPEIVIYREADKNMDPQMLETIFTIPYDDNTIFERSEYYPPIKEGIEYYPIHSLLCNDSMLLLEFAIKYIEQNSDCYIANANLNVLDLPT